MGKSEDNALKLGLKILRDRLIPRQSGYGHTPIMVSQSPMVASHRGMAEARAVPGTAMGKPDSILAMPPAATAKLTVSFLLPIQIDPN